MTSFDQLPVNGGLGDVLQTDRRASWCLRPLIDWAISGMYQLAGGDAMNTEQLEKIGVGPGFVAALDQSGGSTPQALRRYGIPDDA